jgi:integrase
MVRQLSRLTAVAVSKAKTAGMYADGAGLYLQVSASGAKSWIFRFALNGREREMGLGPSHDVTLAQARETASQCRSLKRSGIDPIDDRKAKKRQAQLDASKAITFAEAAEAYITANKAGWRNAKHADQWRNTLKTYVEPVFGSLSVQSVDVGLVLKVVEPIWATKTETAARIRGRIEAILDWASARGYRQGENPARWRGHLENLLPKRSRVHEVNHHKALRFADVGKFMAHLKLQQGTAAQALAFLILTAARTGEVIGARWDEIDLPNRIWTIPPGRMKGRKTHRVPLSQPVLDILKQMEKVGAGDFVFRGGKRDKPLSNMAMLVLLKRMGRGYLTAHGFRSTFRDWVAEETSHPSELAEMALAHSISSKVEAAYRRGDQFDKRRNLMSEWASLCTQSTCHGR